MKKLIQLSVLVFTVLIMTACGGGGSNETVAEEGETSVSFWVHTSTDTAEGEAFQNIVERFNEEYDGEYAADIEFIPRSGSGGGYEDKINAALTTDTMPDVLTLDGPNTAAYAEAGMIAPIGDHISNLDDFLPSIIQQGTYNDELYAIGYSESGVGIFYNEQMLEDAGVDLSTLPTIDDPWTWDQFMELSETLVNEYDVPAIDMGLNSKNEWLMYAFAPFLWSNEGRIVSEDGTTALGVFNDEASVETMNFLQDIVEEGYTTISPVEKAFQTEKYPMLLSGSWTIAEMETSYPDVEYGIMPYPTSPETNELVSPSGSWQFAMSATTEKEEAAGALIDFLTSTESLTEITLKNSVLPAAESVIEEVTDEVSPEMNILIEQNAQSAHARPVLPNYPQVSRIFQQTISDITYSEENNDIQALLDVKAQEIQDVLE